LTTETVRKPSDSAIHPLDDPVRSSLRGAHARFAVWSGRIARYDREVGGFVGHPGERGSVRSWLGDAVLTKNDDGLIQAVNRALNHVIENGTYEKALDRWGLGNQAVDKSEIDPPGLPMKS
jgi:hypothetical protein